MHFNPEKSCEAHSQIGLAGHVAASSMPLVSPRSLSGARDPSPVAGDRGAATGQPIQSIRAKVSAALRGGERGAQALVAFLAIALIFALAILA